MDRWLNIGVLGGACWPTKEQIINFHGHELMLKHIETSLKAKLSLALYREALSINSIPFAFLSYFKILNVFGKINILMVKMN